MDYTVKGILKKEGLKGKELAELLGMHYDWYRKCTMPSAKKTSARITAFVLGYQLADIGKTALGLEKFDRAAVLLYEGMGTALLRKGDTLILKTEDTEVSVDLKR